MLTNSMTGPPAAEEEVDGSDEEEGARTVFNASRCFLKRRVRFLVAIIWDPKGSETMEIGSGENGK